MKQTIDLKIFDKNYREVNFSVDYFVFDENRFIFYASLNNMELEFNYFEFLDNFGDFDLAILDQKTNDFNFFSNNIIEKRSTTLNFISNLDVVHKDSEYKLEISFDILDSEYIDMNKYKESIKSLRRDFKLKELGI
jgi:hypothetical protein